jgi:catechol 2,3-dioxygenase-like lactoylglutathione lyase family enzyme
MNRLKRLAHVNIRASRLAETIAFYRDVLGLVATPIPGTDDMTHRAWLRDPSGDPIIHVGDLDMGTGAAGGAARGGGAIDHVAFECRDIQGFRAHLDALGHGYRHNAVPAAGLEQLFVEDPDGILIELNFFTDA